MPLVRISIARGSLSAAAQRLLADGVHHALVSTAGVPPDDRFQLVEELAPENLIFDAHYLGIERRGPAVWVQVFLNTGRSVAVKQALYASLAEAIEAAGLRREDLLVNLVEVARENWSFGNGLMSYPPATS
jgi:phenylpyruvate tautomerase PptA (4-oxalocrotonate tautomerase family)